jgi:hypothetical protein
LGGLQGSRALAIDPFSAAAFASASNTALGSATPDTVANDQHLRDRKWRARRRHGHGIGGDTAMASASELGLLYAVAAENDDLTRDRMRAFYDGTFFYDLAEERAGQPWCGWWL